MDATNNSQVKKKPLWKIVLRETLAFALWLYLFVKLFVFDFDVYAIETYLPSWAWLVHFKFLVFLVLTCVYWVTVGDKNFLKSIGFVLIYPFVLFFWRLPKLLFRNWMVVFGAVSYSVSFLNSLKSNLISFTVVLTASVLIVVSDQKVLISIAAATLSVWLLVHYVRRVYQSFVPANALFLPKEPLIKLLDKAKNQFALPAELKKVSIAKFTPEQRSKWVGPLQSLVLINRVTYYVAFKLREIQERRIIIVYFIVGLMLTFLLTVCVFALDNLALYKYDPNSFTRSESHGLWFFLYYSANTILTSSIADFNPISTAARLLSTVEVYLGIFVVVILFFVYTSVRNPRTKTQLDDIIISFENQGKQLELYVNKEFSIDIERAIDELARMPGTIIKLIYFFSIHRR